MQILNVDLKERSYPIYIGEDLSYGQLCRKALPKCQDVMIVSNTTIAPLYLDKCRSSLEDEGFKVATCILPDGESYKTVDSYMQIMTALISASFGRDCALIALGGGVVGDMTGFAAATYQRGVAYVQIPTTLLAMVDSSVGGKTAINHPQGKNMIGAFYQPKAVIADINTLKTLPEKERSAGLAEVIKAGIIIDGEFFKFLEENADKLLSFDVSLLEQIVYRCCDIKAKVVALDEREGGIRALLNLGHTFGHAIEAFLGFGTWLHGEAVGAGTVIAAKVAEDKGFITKDDVKRICSLLDKAKLPIDFPKNMTGSDFMRLMRHDKKVKSGHIRYVLPTAIGKSAVFSDLSDDYVMQLLETMR